MPNDFFQFKQFRIHQKGATLKVCTDSCLFGAWVADSFVQVSKVLDIGTGTGLLALMLAQKQDVAEITALEIDTTSASLAQLNVSLSPWSDRVRVATGSLQEFKSSLPFDLILSNPPFFEDQLQAKKKRLNLAKHQLGLTKEELLDHTLLLMSEQGHFCVLFPDAEAHRFQLLAESKGLFLTRETLVRNKMDGPIFRRMQVYVRNKGELQQSELVIYKAQQQYTDQFIALLKPYYLYL